MEPSNVQNREQAAMNYTLKNIPDDIYEKIRQQAQKHGRSVNSEIIAILSDTVKPRAKNVAEILARAREIRSRTRGFLTDDFLKKAKREGLP